MVGSSAAGAVCVLGLRRNTTTRPAFQGSSPTTQGPLHRDIKPSNVMVQDGDADDGLEVKLLDLGIIRPIEQRGLGGREPGTERYMAPELKRDEAAACPASDLFSFGVLLHKAVTGHLPPEELDRPTRLLDDLSLDAAAAILGCLRNANARPATAMEVARTIEVAPAGARELMPVLPGEFMMGSLETEPGRKPDETMHPVSIAAPYAIGAHAVTQELWEEIMESNPSSSHDPRRPVDHVSWWDAVEFCNRLSVSDGLQPAYDIDRRTITHRNDFLMFKRSEERKVESCTWNRGAPGYRLPTEAEWEYADRAGCEHRHSGSDNPLDVAWFGLDGEDPRANGTKNPNAWGLHDMCGNVVEWVWDWYVPFADARLVDPAGPEDGTRRVLRGGHVRHPADRVRTASRSRLDPARAAPLV